MQLRQKSCYQWTWQNIGIIRCNIKLYFYLVYLLN